MKDRMCIPLERPISISGRRPKVFTRIVQDPFAGFMILMDLESTNLRGEEIWRLYRDVHHMDLDGVIQDVKARAGCLSRLRV
jgi:exosome complex RNA-binding protein Rrp42 (RNase PH superfamily)